MNTVFVVDTNKHPLNPVHPGRARMLLSTGRAAVLKRYPFTIVLKRAVETPQVNPLRIKLDPGSKITGIAVVNDANGQVIFAAELSHRGTAIKKALDERRVLRRSRRNRHTRYRKPRFHNRPRGKGWLPPSLESRIANVFTWTRRLSKLCPIMAMSLELVKFDTQLLDHPQIQGVQYQQGTLAGYEVREYLLHKWNRTCAYCGQTNVPLQIEHIRPRARNGSNRISNLTLACKPCNRAKSTQDIQEFLAKNPERLACILAQVKAPLQDAAAVNATRWALYDRLKALGLPIECGSGGLTKYNRTRRVLPKAHWIDAVCVGTSTPEVMQVKSVVPVRIQANGYGCRQMCGTDKWGFPTRHRHRQRRYFGFQTGDIVRAVVTRGKKVGIYTGRVLVRASGSFDIATSSGRAQGISHRYCTILHRRDGYGYTYPKGGNSSPR